MQFERDDDATPTPGERLMYALGQLYLLWHHGDLAVAPADIDVDRVARIVGVNRDIEFQTEGPLGRCYHFPSEVLLVDDLYDFPWRLHDLENWALLMDLSSRDAS